MKNKTFLFILALLFSQSYFQSVQAQEVNGIKTHDLCGMVTMTVSGNQIFYTNINSAVQKIHITRADSKTTVVDVATVCSAAATSKTPCKGNLQTEKLGIGTYKTEITFLDGKKTAICRRKVIIQEPISKYCNITEEPYEATRINSLRTWDWSDVVFPPDPDDWSGNTDFRNLYGFGISIDKIEQVGNQASPQEMLNIDNGQLNFFLPPYIGDAPHIPEGKIDYRSEIRIHQRLPLGTKQWFGWTYTFGDDYLIDPEKTTIFQIHPGTGYSPQFNIEISDGGSSNDGEVPVGELEVITNVTLDGIHDGNIKKRTYIKPQAGQSIRFAVYIKYGTKGEEGIPTNEDGALEVRMNGNLVYRGITPTAHCYAQYGGNAKWGIYHPTWKDSHSNTLNSINSLTDDDGVLHGLRLAMSDLSIVTREPGDPYYDENESANIFVNANHTRFSPIDAPCFCSGTPCDDGDPTTINDVEDGQCNCQGIHQICKKIPVDEDDGVEQSSGVELKSHCLNLGDGIIGLRFSDMPGMETRKIQSAFIQFTSAAVQAQTEQVDLEIYAANIGTNPHREFDDNSSTDISSRVNSGSLKTDWTINTSWQCHDDITDGGHLNSCDDTPNLDDPCSSSSNLECRGENGPNQRTPDLAKLVQKIVNSPDYAANNDLVFIIKPTSGSSIRSIMSFDRSIDNAPQLCIRYSDASGLPGDPDKEEARKTHSEYLPENTFQINPNPITQEFEITTTISIPGSTIQVFNVNGQLIKTIETATVAESKIDASSWSPGMYYFLLNDGEKQYSQKVIKL